MILATLATMALAADPDLALTVDAAALRQQAPVTALTRAWAGDPAWTTIQARLDAAVANGWPPVTAWLHRAEAVTLERRGRAWGLGLTGPVEAWPGLPSAPVVPPTAPVAWAWDVAPTLLALDRLGVEVPLDGWRGASATLRGTWTVTEGAWGSVTTLSTPARLALRPVDATVTEAPALVALAAHPDPAALARLLVSALRPGHRRFLEERLGATLPEFARQLTGDVWLRIEDTGLLPAVTVSLGLNEDTSLTLVQVLGDNFRGTPATIAGAVLAVRLDTPLGPWLAAIAPGRLVFGNDVARLTMALQRTPVAPSGTLLAARADLPQLVSRFLPLALAARADLGEDPLPPLATAITTLALAQAQAGSSIAAGLAPESVLRITQGQVIRQVRLDDATRRQLKDLLGPVPDDALAVYAPLVGEDRVQAALRVADGWVILEDAARGHAQPVALEAATRRLRDLGTTRHILGRPVADLDVVTLPQVPRLDRACLPAAGILGQAVVPWRADLRIDPEGAGAVLTEQGVPLFDLVLLGLALAADRLPAEVRSPGPATEL